MKKWEELNNLEKSILFLTFPLWTALIVAVGFSMLVLYGVAMVYDGVTSILYGEQR